MASAVRFFDDFGGKGELLLCVHGLGGSSNSWYPQGAALSRDFHIVAFDLAGSGRSPVRDGISIQSHVADLLDVVHTRGEGKPVHIAAHSMGTIIAQHFAVAHPHLVSSLALVGGFSEPPPAAREALRNRAAKVREAGMAGIADAIVATGTSGDTRTNSPAAAAFVRESILAQPAEGYARNCEALAAAQAADLSKIGGPVLLLNGDEDKTAPPDVARAIASQLKSAEAQVLSGCGHWATIERAKQVNYALTVFYARQRRARADT